MNSLQKLQSMFDKRTQNSLIIIVIAIIISALLEIAALGIIAPFIELVLDSSAIYENAYLYFVYSRLGFTNETMFLAFLGLTIVVVYLLRGIYMAVFNFLQFRYLANKQAEFSVLILDKIIGFSYLYHTKKNIAELLRTVVTDVADMFRAIRSMLFFVSDFFMSVAIIVFLIIVSPLMTLSVAFLAAACVLIYLKLFRNKVLSYGAKFRESSVDMTKSVNQALGGLKEVKILQKEAHFKKEFEKSAHIQAFSYSNFLFADTLPRLIIETVCFGGAFVVVSVMIFSGVDVYEMIPQLSMFVLAAFRLLPMVARLISSVNSFSFLKNMIDTVHRNMTEQDLLNEVASPAMIETKTKDITIKDLTFSYPETETNVFENVSFTIPHHKSIAFVGETGAGKSTLVDILLGLINPQQGGVYYEGKSIHHHFGEFSKNIGYVPQSIYLLDETIRENIAFGIAKDAIDNAKVWQAIKQAKLEDFITSLPNGIDTVVGDRGILLSGGQRQRIGIARAIYNDPEILVLDEATSALDNETENYIMDQIIGFQGNKTIIIVAHRLSTIEHCDVIYKVEAGGVERVAHA